MFLICPIGTRPDFPVKIIYNCSWFWSQMKSNGIRHAWSCLAHLKIRLMSSLFLRTEDDLREYALCEGAAHRDEFAFFLLMQPSDYSSEHFSPCPPLLPPSILYSLWKWPSNWFPFFLLCALAVYFPPGTYSDLSEMSFQNITLPLSTFQ